MSNVAINILAEFTGKKAFDKANKSVSALEASTKKLAKQLVGVFAVSKVISFGKASVKAFSEDEAAATRLAGAMDNLGLSFSKVLAADFIANLEKTSGIVDGNLRPAFQALLTTTGSLTQSQKLLNDAITISRASGIELTTVAQDLANGYVGITKGLKKYNTGLTQAELKSKSFSDVLGTLLSRSAGAAEAYLGTTAYKLDVLTVAADNAKESIGAGLVDAFAKAAGGTSVQDAAKAFDTIAKSINGISSAIGTTIGFFTKLYKKLDDFTYNFDPILGDSKAMQDRMAMVGSARQSTTGGAMARQAQQKQAEAEAAKRAKELAALQAKQVKAQKALTAEQKKQAALKKAGTIFDLDQIQLVAALKGKLTEEEQKRVKLQLALLMENESEAAKLSSEIAMAIDSTGALARFLTTLPDAKNPFANWNNYIAAAATVPMNGAGLDFGGNKIGAPVLNFAPSNQYGAPAAAPVVVQIDGKTIASALMDQSLSGNQAYVNRRTGGFE